MPFVFYYSKMGVNYNESELQNNARRLKKAQCISCVHQLEVSTGY